MTGDRPEDWVAAWGETEVARPSGTVIDVHSHLMVPESVELTRPHLRPEDEPRTFFSSPVTNQLNRDFYTLAKDKYTDPGARLEDMDAMGVDVQMVALTPLQYFYSADAGLAPVVAAMQNERIAEMSSFDPGRLVGVGTLPLAHPEASVAEARRVSGLGFPAVEIGADVNGGDLDDRGLDPVWDILEELGLVVILHPAGFTEARRLSDYYLVNVIGMPLSTTLAVTRMIVGGVFERHPGLQMLLVHGGGYLPFYPARLDHAFRHRPELRGHIDRLPSEYLAGLYYDTTVFDPELVEQLVRRYGADHVLLGTDYPFDMGLTDPLALLADSKLTQEERSSIAGGNARRLFGIG
ncbi:MAG TPA: amidohydrolase family protein [Acidimicrobiia bacterium]